MSANLKGLNPIDKSAMAFGLRPDRKPRLRSVVLMVVCVTAIGQIQMMLSGCGGGGNGGMNTTPPVIAISSPTSGATVSGTIDVTATASSKGVAGVQMLLDGAALGSEVTGIPYTITWDTTTAAPGTHALAATARDSAANHATSASVTVTVSRTSSSGHFSTLAPGSALPSESDCAVQVRRSSWEPRADNATANNTNVYAQGSRLTGSYLNQYGYESRVTGNFTGTTDEIIQWGACKWGIDEDIVRAQSVQESYWHQSTLGDCNGGPTVPETHGCQSVGLLQVKGADIPPTHLGTWPYAYQSTAFNVDYMLGVLRACYEGKETWLGNGYQAGDIWGCVGRWFSGDWYKTSQQYIASVQAIQARKDWLSPGF